MAAKMSPKDAIRYFGVRLLKELPLDNDVFLAEVDCAKLLSLNYKAHINARATRGEKVAFFKERVLEPGPDIYLPILLDVMDDCGDAVTKRLAEDIREATGLRKYILIHCICVCMYNDKSTYVLPWLILFTTTYAIFNRRIIVYVDRCISICDPV